MFNIYLKYLLTRDRVTERRRPVNRTARLQNELLTAALQKEKKNQ